jgi:hypothetical protein
MVRRLLYRAAMKRTKLRKLSLDKQTIVLLAGESLADIAGGNPNKSKKPTTCESQRLSCFEGPCTIDTIIDL